MRCGVSPARPASSYRRAFAVAEVSAAFHRKLREEAVTPAVFKALQGQFVHDVDEGLWKLADPTAALLRDVQAAFFQLERGSSFDRWTRSTS